MRWISSLNGSSFEGVGGREYFGGSALRMAWRTVSRCSSRRRAILRMGTFSTKCRRRISAH
jgi:hypothetical protein